MAKQGKPERDDHSAKSAEHELVTMARGLAEIAAAHNLSELIVDTKETTLTIRRGGGQVVQMHQMAPMPMQPMQMTPMHHAPAAHAPAAPTAAAAAPVDDKAHVVTSPFVGTFYRKPNPDSPSYVAIGDKVEKGAVLCIVEAMKLMNEIEADIAGTISGILVEDGTSVEYGQPLFKITV
jgi:acetyl-CoA carboxylase biotin carboxyl carrier protein